MPTLARKFFAALLLMLHLLSSSGMATITFFALAKWEGNHEVRLECTGRVSRVVLSHLEQMLTPRPNDHADALGQVLASLCENDNQGDHVFEQITEQTLVSSKMGTLSRSMSARGGNSPPSAYRSMFDPSNNSLLKVKPLKVGEQLSRRWLSHTRSWRRASHGSVAWLV
jgi:hypothetical protein